MTTDIKALRKAVAKRTRLVKKIARFVLETTEKHGKIVSETEGHSHTRVKRQLVLGDLVFSTHLDQSMMGGNTVTIFYPEEDVVAFSLYWQVEMGDDKKWTITWTAGSVQSYWFTEVNKLMQRGAVQKKLATLKREVESEERRLTREKAEAAEREVLEKKARSLGLDIPGES